MRKAFPAILLLAATLAAVPAPKPVITASGIAAAAGLDASVKNGIARSVERLNTGLVKFIALHKEYDAALPADRDRIQHEIDQVHAQCKPLHDAIVKQLDPDQQQAYFAYLHAQLKAAGIDMTQMEHGGMAPDSMHAMGHGG